MGASILTELYSHQEIFILLAGMLVINMVTLFLMIQVIVKHVMGMIIPAGHQDIPVISVIRQVPHRPGEQSVHFVMEVWIIKPVLLQMVPEEKQLCHQVPLVFTQLMLRQVTLITAMIV